MKLFKSFLYIWSIGSVCSFVPFLHLGAIAGIPAVFLAAVLTTLAFRKELSK